jgi:uncharacterized protein (TIGR02246 family)
MVFVRNDRNRMATLSRGWFVTSDEKEIRRVIARWHDATAEGGVDEILELMSEDVVFLVAGHEPMCGRRAFADGLRSLLKTHKVESSGIVQEVVVSGDLGYSWTQLKVSTSLLAGSDTVTRTGSTLSIFRKMPNGAWVLARDANLLTPVSQRY